MRCYALAVVGVAALGGCEPREEQPPPKHAKSECPPPPEPTHVATVVGTIGKLHLVESRYPLSRIGDAIAASKPDLVLVGAVPDREDEASFEMAYARFVAKEHGAAVEAIDWGARPPRALPLFTFEQANGDELARRMLGTASEDADKNGARAAWITSRVAAAVEHQLRPKHVLAVVDVSDRPLVDSVLHELGYTTRSPVELVTGAKETMAGDVPPEVVAEWSRARMKAEGDRAKILDLVIEKRGACCVARSALP